MDRTAASLEQVENQRNADFLILRQGLGYCWSTAVAALPVEGRALMEKWLVKSDRDIEWIMKENLKKARLARMDANWVKQWRSRLEVWTGAQPPRAKSYHYSGSCGAKDDPPSWELQPRWLRCTRKTTCVCPLHLTQLRMRPSIRGSEC